METPLDSFRVASKPSKRYIEPDFDKDKETFVREKPSILLISAVGASGKSALAQELSSRIRLPLLDLAKNKPVGDSTLRGLLTSAFPMASLGDVFSGIAVGTFGVVIDGLDEGRAMTSEGAFSAFMDDIAKMASAANGVSFVLLGREQSIDAAFIMLSDRGVTPGIATLCRFTRKQAEDYVDALTDGLKSSQAGQYVEARNVILDRLSSAFRGNQVTDNLDNAEFLSFIGYPPVLDAIATLLGNRKNYHNTIEELNTSSSSKVEISLLYDIALHILNRERSEKVIPIVTKQVLGDLAATEQIKICDSIYSVDEQCVRLIEYCLGSKQSRLWLEDPVLNGRYEECLDTFFYEHPFLTGNGPQFRNVIFEAMVLATLYCSDLPEYSKLAETYLRGRKSSYYLVYFLDILAPARHLPANAIGPLLNCALEFRSKGTSVYLSVDGDSYDLASPDDVSMPTEVEVEVLSEEANRSTRMLFTSDLRSDSVLAIENRLASASISVPCDVLLHSTQEFEINSPVEISARRIIFGCTKLVLKELARVDEKRQHEKEVFLSAGSIISELQHLTPNGVSLNIEVTDRSGIYHPLAPHVTITQAIPSDSNLQEKYLRLRKLLTHFRSHSKGRMAKYRDKVDNERVAGNAIGNAVLTRLLDDKILYTEGNFYFIEPDAMGAYLGVSWSDLRKGSATEKLIQYLGAVK